MNFALLRWLKGTTPQEVIDEYGFLVFERVLATAHYYTIIDERLYRVQDDRTLKEVVRPLDRMIILTQLHEALGHIQITKLHNVAPQYYHWLYLYEDCVRVVHQCVGCQAYKGEQRFKPLKQVHKGFRPFAAWEVDYIPSLPRNGEGFQHLLIFVDSFRKRVEVVPMRTKESGEVADAILLHLVARYGVSIELSFDRGLKFAGDVDALCDRLQIKKKTISTRHPQGNDQVERCVGAIKLGLTVTLIHELKEHDQGMFCIPACLMGLRFTIQKVLGVSPYLVCLGLEPRLPVVSGRVHKELELADDRDVQNFASGLASFIKKLDADITRRLEQGDRAYKQYFDSRHMLVIRGDRTGTAFC